jgi:expansin (peptidoglycan-binding protein)
MSAGNPTYIQFCVTGSSQTITRVEISTYNWEDNLENPVKQWFNVTQAGYDPTCWFYGATTTTRLVYLPASLRITAQTGQQLVFTNVLTSLSQNTYVVPDFNSTTPYVPGADLPLSSSLNAYGNVSSYNTAGTWFDPTAGACSLNPAPAPYDTMYAAIRVQDWQTSLPCGQCLLLCNSTGYSVEVQVLDQCPFPNVCTRYHWLDVSPAAFNALTNNNKAWGIAQMSWRYIECSATVATNVSYLFQNYSQNYGFALQVRSYRIGLQSLAIQSKSSGSNPWISLNRTASNYFVYSSGAVVQCPCRLRLVSITGETVIDENAFTVDIGSLPKSTAIKGNVQFSVIPPEFQNNGQCTPANGTTTTTQTPTTQGPTTSTTRTPTVAPTSLSPSQTPTPAPTNTSSMLQNLMSVTLVLLFCIAVLA